MRLEYKGTIGCGDAYRCSEEPDSDGAIFIGETDLVNAILDEATSKEVSVIFNGEVVASGLCFGELGWGYSEYTPMDPDRLKVDDFDIIEFLSERNGLECTLVITDEVPA